MYDDMNGVTKCTHQGPEIMDINYSKQIQKRVIQLHANMFFEDMCNSYSIALCKDYSTRDFFKFNGDEAKINQIFGYDFLRYNLDELLSNITKNLMLFGQAYVERVYCYDDNNELKKVLYTCINCKIIKKRIKHVCYIAKDSDGHIYKGKILTKNVISFKLKDIGFSKRFFINKMRKLKKMEFPDAQLTVNKDFSWNAFRDEKDFYLLKLMRGVCWSARKTDNQYVNEPYLIYRNMMFKKLKNRLLEYLVSKINDDIISIKNDIGFKGQIVFESITQKYDTLLKEFDDGTKNCQDICNVIYKGL